MKLKFNNSNKLITINGYSTLKNVIALYYVDPVENLSGFQICENNSVIVDAPEFKYRWDVLDHKSNAIYYTNDSNYKQTEPWPDMSDVPEPVEPLSNEELTECIAELMYESSLRQLGL